AMALGIVEECRKLSLEYARTRVQFGKPIGEFQLIQDKLAKMEVARMNLQNLVFRQIELAGAGKSLDLAEASACKLYAARATMEVAFGRCSSTAATVTWPSTASSSCVATRRCCRSTAAPTRSRSRRSRAACSLRESGAGATSSTADDEFARGRSQ